MTTLHAMRKWRSHAAKQPEIQAARGFVSILYAIALGGICAPTRCAGGFQRALIIRKPAARRDTQTLSNTIAYITSWRLAGAGRFARIALIMVQAVSPVTSLCHILCFESHSKQIVVIRNSCTSIKTIPNCELTSITMNPKF